MSHHQATEFSRSSAEAHLANGIARMFPKVSRRLAFAGAILAVFVAPSHADPQRSANCSSRIRAVHATLIDRDNVTFMSGSTAFMRAMTKRVLDLAGLDAELHETPYARAIADFADGRADLVLMSETSMKQADPKSKKVQMMRLPVVIYTRSPSQEHPLTSSSVIGTLRGFAIPHQASSAGAKFYDVSSVDSLFKMLSLGRVTHALVVKSNADIYLANKPEMRTKVEESVRIQGQYMAAHISSRLSAPCAERLARAALAVRTTDMERLFAQYVPELDYNDFKY